MTFTEFQDYVQSNIRNYLPQAYNNSQILLQNVTKKGDMVLTGLCVELPNTNTRPTIYLNQYYDEYAEHGDIDRAMKTIASQVVYCEGMSIAQQNFDFNLISDFNKVKNIIMPRLMNADNNQSYLQDKPHKYIEDMAVTYYIELNQQMTIPVNNDILKSYNISINTLHDTAINNLVKDVVCFSIAPGAPMLILSRHDGIDGAALMLSTKILNKIATDLNDNLYIIPSSVDEVMLIHESIVHDKNDISNSIPQVNKMLNTAMKLSNNLYIYNKQTDKVDVAVYG